MRSVTNDDVIADGDAEELAGADESTRELDVVDARRRVSTRVIVRVMCRRSLCGRGRWEPPIIPVDTLIAAHNGLGQNQAVFVTVGQRGDCPEPILFVPGSSINPARSVQADCEP